MAAQKKYPDRLTLSTPRGTLKFPKLNEVDYGSDKYPDKDGSWNTRYVADKSDPKVAAFLAKVDVALERSKELAEAAVAELPVKARKELEAKGGLRQAAPYAPVYDEDTEEETGQIDMKVKHRYSGKYSKGVKQGQTWTSDGPGMFDARGKKLPRSIKIWGGTVAILNIDLDPYFIPATGEYGLSRRLNAVQIIELVSAGQRAASSYGFGEEEGGFDAEEYVGQNADDENTGTVGGNGSSSDDQNTDF